MPPHSPTIADALGRVASVTRSALAQIGGQVVLVGCSGGADSVALAGLMAMLRARERWRVVLGHVDHGLRGASRAESEQVERLGDALGLAVRVERLQLAPAAGLPARARDARRHALESMAHAEGANAVALAHTATDQAETMLMHLARGAGLEGVAGMAELDAQAAVARVRPLLWASRGQTRALALEMGLPIIDDPTNDDPHHFRVAIRHEVLPILAGDRDGVENAFAAAARQARDAQDALAWVVQRELARRRTSRGWVIDGVKRLPRALRTRFVLAVCQRGGADPSALSRRTIDAIDDALRRGDSAPRSWDLHPHRRLNLINGHLTVD